MFRDGSRDLGWFTRDTFNLEGVEVFFGPSSVLFGRGSTGGAVNLVTKTPARAPSPTWADRGTAPQGPSEADVNHTLFDKVQVRVNGMGQAGGVQGRNTIEKNRAGLAPSFRLELGRAPCWASITSTSASAACPTTGSRFTRACPSRPTRPGCLPQRLLRGRGLRQGRGRRPRRQLPRGARAEPDRAPVERSRGGGSIASRCRRRRATWRRP